MCLSLRLSAVPALPSVGWGPGSKLPLSFPTGPEARSWWKGLAPQGPSFLTLLHLRPIVAAMAACSCQGLGRRQGCSVLSRRVTLLIGRGLVPQPSRGNGISGEGPVRPPALPDLSAGAPDRAAGWPSQSLHRSFTEQRATGLPGDWSQ